MSFFDSQPVGRLINRFSRDIEALDVNLGEVVLSCTDCLVAVLGSILVVLFVTPGVLLALVPLFFLYWRVQVRKSYSFTLFVSKDALRFFIRSLQH
jgi:ABC-type multidrug transport system fused ATPase/permease subunit